MIRHLPPWEGENRKSHLAKHHATESLSSKELETVKAELEHHKEIEEVLLKTMHTLLGERSVRNDDESDITDPLAIKTTP